ncbi:MAG TPA: SRPBCC domain-containing protein, partial [Spirochaetia bacterium]|nr:SRPBCC domain-containing protein [Spirochaetia bacterium]
KVPAGSTIVEIDLIPQGEGTLLRLTHRNLPPDADVRSTHDYGWSHHFGRLKIAAEGGDPGPDPCWMEAPHGSRSTTARQSRVG